MPVKPSSGAVVLFCARLKENHSHHGPFIPEAATMMFQGLQEMQASAGSDLSSSSIHLAVVAGKSAARVHCVNKVSPLIFSYHSILVVRFSHKNFVSGSIRISASSLW